MKKKIFFVLLIGFFLVGCTVCQPEGAYEKCVAEGGTLCVDLYPKCEEK